MKGATMTIVTIQKDTPFRVEPKTVLNAVSETNPRDVVVIAVAGNGKIAVYSSCSGERTDTLMERGATEIERLTQTVEDAA
mgnify:CR=1 FL=1